jgi:hypothetical protein
VAIDHFYKSCTETDLASLHYVIFIEPLVIFQKKAMSFDSKQFTSNCITKVIEAKTNDPFLLLEENFFTAVLLYKTNYEVQFEHLSHEVLEFFSEL